MARSLLLTVAVAACALLVATDTAEAGRRHRRGCGGCGGYSQGCGGGGCGGYTYNGCGGGACGGSACQGVPYDGQPVPDAGSAPPPPPSAAVTPPAETVVAAPVVTQTYNTTRVNYRRGLFGRNR